MLEIIINKGIDKKSIMLLEDGILIEKHEEHKDQKRLEGNIYYCKVTNVLEGMQSAFVNIGEGKNAFIRLKDILPKEDENKNKNYNNQILNYNIKDYISINDKIVVQVKKDGTETKGARVSTHINLPGRFIVFMPNSNFITISQKIEEVEERERLLNIVKEKLPKNTGAIIRTASKNIEADIIKKDLDNVIKKWEDIKKSYESKPLNVPTLIYDNEALIRRTLMDLVDQNLNRVIVNDKKTYNNVKKILMNMKMSNNIELVLKENQDLTDMYDLKKQLYKLSKRKVWLKSGGFITIDKTEALTAIDVNSGKYTGDKDFEDTVFKVNKEATIEIAKQLRLRDIGGIIIIDYIDMHKEEHKDKIIEILNEELKKDRTKSEILGFTKLNLLEMTRKNMCNNDNF